MQAKIRWEKSRSALPSKVVLSTRSASGKKANSQQSPNLEYPPPQTYPQGLEWWQRPPLGHPLIGARLLYHLHPMSAMVPCLSVPSPPGRMDARAHCMTMWSCGGYGHSEAHITAANVTFSQQASLPMNYKSTYIELNYVIDQISWDGLSIYFVNDHFLKRNKDAFLL